MCPKLVQNIKIPFPRLYKPKETHISYVLPSPSCRIKKRIFPCPVLNHLLALTSRRPSDLTCPRSIVGGSLHTPTAQGLVSGRWVVFPPHSRHTSPSTLWQSPLPRNHSKGKAVCPKLETGSPPNICRVSNTSPLLCHPLRWPPAESPLPHHHTYRTSTSSPIYTATSPSYMLMPLC